MHDPAAEGGHLEVDRAPVVLTRSGDGLVVHGDGGSVENQGVVAADLAGVEQIRDRRQRPLGRVGAKRGEREQHAVATGEPRWPSTHLATNRDGGDAVGVMPVRAWTSLVIFTCPDLSEA